MIYDLEKLCQLAEERFSRVKRCNATEGLCAFNIVLKSKIELQIIPANRKDYNFDVLIIYAVTQWNNCIQLFQDISAKNVILLCNIIFEESQAEPKK